MVSHLLGRNELADHLSRLSARERQVLELMAQGMSNKAVADALVIDLKTVQSHVARIMAKLDLLPTPDKHRRVLAVLAWLRNYLAIRLTKRVTHDGLVPCVSHITWAVEMDRLDEGGGLRLDDQLCFALYAATHAITRRYRPLLDEIGLTYPQYLLMLTLWQDGPATVGRIAHRLELDSHAVTPLVERLEIAGLVRRLRGTDRRQVVVAATQHGRDLKAAAAAVQAEVACATGLDPRELADLRRQLRLLATQLAPQTRSCRTPRSR